MLFGDELRRKSAKLWKIVKVGLDHNEFDALIKEMADENLQLEVLTQGNLELEPIRRERSRNVDSGYWKSVRQFALGLYNCLMSNWPCQCRMSHKASLRLDIRTSSKEDKLLDIKFEVVFVFCDNGGIGPWHWRDTEIRSVDIPEVYAQSFRRKQRLIIHSEGGNGLFPPTQSSGRRVAFANLPSPPSSRTPSLTPSSINAAKIENLCAALARQETAACCLGYLGDGHSQHYVYMAAPQHPAQPTQPTMSLYQILSDETRSPSISIKPKDRYELAVLLSSTILQLYNTPWLSDNWTRKDIYLLSVKAEQATTLAKNFYISKGFSALPTLSAESDPELALLRNASVFNLGLALLELTFGHPVEYYEDEKDLRNGVRTIMTNRLIAERLIGKIEDFEGKRYSDVVYRCIYCDFGCRVTSFENEEFRQNFYKGVVVPLEGILHDFTK